MDDAFKIFVDQLTYGHVKHLSDSLDPKFLEIEEKELKCVDPVIIKGVAYLAEKELILELAASTQVFLPCSICNQQASVPINIPNWFHAVPLVEIRTGIFFFKEPLREAILLEIPLFTECHQGTCPERKEIRKYLKNPSSVEDTTGYYPFVNLE